jgi:hypothetical protein
MLTSTSFLSMSGLFSGVGLAAYGIYQLILTEANVQTEEENSKQRKMGVACVALGVATVAMSIPLFQANRNDEIN